MAEFSKEVAQKLKGGGKKGISAFLAVAKVARDDTGIKGVTEWVQVAFSAIPKKDREIMVAMLVDVYFEAEAKRII